MMSISGAPTRLKPFETRIETPPLGCRGGAPLLAHTGPGFEAPGLSAAASVPLCFFSDIFKQRCYVCQFHVPIFFYSFGDIMLFSMTMTRYTRDTLYLRRTYDLTDLSKWELPSELENAAAA